MVNQTGARALNGPDGGKDSSCRPWRQLGERNGVREQGAREVRFLLDADEYVWVQTSDENGKGKKNLVPKSDRFLAGSSTGLSWAHRNDQGFAVDLEDSGSEDFANIEMKPYTRGESRE
jgi:hypothetical protein